jgi:hypothetical protein
MAKKSNFCKTTQLAAPQNQGFDRDAYILTMPPFYKTNPIFYLILSDATG